MLKTELKTGPTLILCDDGRVFRDSDGICLGRVRPGPGVGWVASGVSDRLYPTQEHAALGLALFAERTGGADA